MVRMICIGCGRELEAGELYIEDTVSGFLKSDADPEIDDIMATIFPGPGEDKVIFCADCTEPGGDYIFKKVGDE